MNTVDLPARCVNRSAIVVRPRDPYIEWACGLDDDAAEAAEMLRDHYSLYLVPEAEMMSDLDRWLREYAGEIFERELCGWHRDADAWPADRSFERCGEWFQVDTVSMVIDLDGARLRVERL